MIGNSFLTINKVKRGYNQGIPKEDLGAFVLVCLTLYTKTLSNNFPELFPPSPYHKESLYFVYKWIPKGLLQIAH